MTEQERYAWIQLALTPYIGAESFSALLQQYGSAQAALAAPAHVIAASAYQGKKAAAAWNDTAQAKSAADAALRWETQSGCRLLLACDEDYPALLNEGLTAPPLLFVRGDVSLLHRPSVAIVGSRHATPQAMRTARHFGCALSESGITVISGMAAGIDTAAHTGALAASGGTIAVWGTGIDRIYPPGNASLAHQIAENGVVVSEFPLGTRPLAGNFPRRNRLIAAQSYATLVVEAALESGSLITARLAAEMGREVMAIPGSIDNPHSKGCHKLIKEGAKLVECLEDIISECPMLNVSGSHISPSYSEPNHNLSTDLSESRQPETLAVHTRNTAQTKPHEAKPQEPLDAEQHPVWQQMGYTPVHPDTLAEQTGISAADIYALLTEWELEGKIAAMAGGRYQRLR